MTKIPATWLVFASLLVAASGATVHAEELGPGQVLSLAPAGSDAVEVRLRLTGWNEQESGGIDVSKIHLEVSDRGRIVAQSVRRIAEDDNPVLISLLIDVSGSVARHLDAIKLAASAFVRQLAADDSCELLTFGAGVKTISDLGASREELLSALGELEASDAKTYLHRAVDYAVRRAVAVPRGHGAIVVLTDGRDDGSKMDPAAVFRMAEKSQVPVYTVAFGGDADRGFLRQLATLSRGASYEVERGDSLAVAYSSILDRLKPVYQVRFGVPLGALSGRQGRLVVSLNNRNVDLPLDLSTLIPPLTQDTQNWDDRLLWAWLCLAVAVSGLGGRAVLNRHVKRGRVSGDTAVVSDDLAATVVPTRAWLDVVAGLHLGDRFPLGGDSTIGRDSRQCPALLSRDPLVGRIHARLFRDACGQYFLEDLGSKNGTRVNESLIHAPVRLQTGDRISLGMSRLVFTDSRQLCA